MAKKVLVTGGAGFIGSNVVDRLIEEGFEVAVMDNLSTGRTENLNDRAEFFEADIRDREKVREIFKTFKPDYVNHHAAQIDVRKSVSDPVFDLQTNIVGTINLIQEAVSQGLEKFLYISTGGAVYGEPEDLPADETCPVKPIAPYGISKHTAEHYLYLYSHNLGLKYTVLRYANVYGPRQNPEGEAGVIAIFTNKMLKGERPQIFGSGKQTRDYVYVKDIVRANLLALETGDYGIYNLGTGIETSVLQIFNLLKRFTGFDRSPEFLPEREGEVSRISLDANRAAAELNWQPEYDIESGIRETVDYYQK